MIPNFHIDGMKRNGFVYKPRNLGYLITWLYSILIQQFGGKGYRVGPMVGALHLV